MAIMPRMLFGAHLQPLREFATPKGLEEATLQALYRALDIGDLVAFAGAGMSADYGYPTWTKLGTDVVTEVKVAAKKLVPPISGVEQQFLDEMTPSRLEQADGNRLTSILDYCQRLFFRRNQEVDFRKIVLASIFREEISPSGMTPIRAVIQHLKIRRFVTTNYDSVIPSVLLPELIREGLASTRDGKPDCPTINRVTATSADLVLFAMGAGTYRSGVLYLHGRATNKDDVNSAIVLTEAQYQRPYASNEALARDLREAYGLIFAANSVLFVGTSLEEDDILRPLRQFISDNDIASRHRPWFALVDCPPKERERQAEIFNRYYYRYGIRVIFVPREDHETRGEALTRKIADLEEGWEEYRRGRREVPHARVTRFNKVLDKPKHSVVAHHAAVYEPAETQFDLRKLIASAKAQANGVRKTFFVIGAQGRGKGRTGYEISQYRHRVGTKTIGFFGTTHFANEFSSLVDGARRHLVDAIGKDPSEPHRTNIERFFDALIEVQADCFFVFGGVERLLRYLPYNIPNQPGENPANRGQNSEEHETTDVTSQMLMQHRWGRSANLEISQFFMGALEFGRENAAPKGQPGDNRKTNFFKCVFLTSSVIPYALQQDIKSKKTREDVLVPIRSLVPTPVRYSIDDALSGASEQAAMELRPRLTAILGFVRQNLYAIDALHHVVNFALNADPPGASHCVPWLRDLALNLGRTESEARPQEIVRSAIAFLSSGDLTGGTPGFVSASSGAFPIQTRRWTRLGMVLEALSLFTTPVETYVLATALETSPLDPYVDAAIREKKEPDQPNWTRAEWQEVLPAFLDEIYYKTRLVLRIHPVPNSGEEFRYTTHSLVRSTILRRLGGRPDRPAEIQQFDLNDFASEPADVQPLKVEGAERALRAFDALVSRPCGRI